MKEQLDEIQMILDRIEKTWTNDNEIMIKQMNQINENVKKLELQKEEAEKVLNNVENIVITLFASAIMAFLVKITFPNAPLWAYILTGGIVGIFALYKNNH